MSELRLVIWDVDGTLANSRAAVARCMQAAFEETGLAYPGDGPALDGVGLSLGVLFDRLVPDASEMEKESLADNYRAAYAAMRSMAGAKDLSPLFDGIRGVLDQFHGETWTLQAVATGKSKRGLDAFIEAHQLEQYFISQQVADFNPSKPHPAMITAALDDAGVSAENAVMVGDTTFDIEMARAAGVAAIGVSWGFHDVSLLQADVVAHTPEGLPGLINEVLG